MHNFTSRNNIFKVISLAVCLSLTGCSLDGGKARQRKAVTRVLFDAESARFEDEVKSPKRDSVWCGRVNAKNRLGGMVGFRRYIVTLSSDGTDSQSDSVEFEPIDDGRPELKETFGNIWTLMCAAR